MLYTIQNRVDSLPQVLKAAQDPKFCFKQNVDSIYNLHQLRNSWVALRKGGFRVDHIFISPAIAFDIRMAPESRDWFDYESQNCLLDLGLIGTIWGALLLENNDVPKDTLLFVGRKPGSREIEESDLHVGVLKLSISTESRFE